ncbi:hypothetical protein APX70_03966, partial [Pseudomonas syringae pv. maculicola]
MSKVNEGLRIIADDRHALVMNEQSMVNAETLITGERPPSTMDFLCLASTLELIQAILSREGKSCPERLSDAQAAGADRGQTFHALRASGIAMRVLGDVGRRAALGAGQFGRGEVDYRPGFWLHPELVLPLARWIASRKVPPRKTPLIAFLKKHLPSAATGKARGCATPHSIQRSAHRRSSAAHLSGTASHPINSVHSTTTWLCSIQTPQSRQTPAVKTCGALL